MGKIKGLKFGDVIVNHWASENNPHRVGVFVKEKNQGIEFTNTTGDFWSIVNDEESRFEKVGSIFDGADIE